MDNDSFDWSKEEGTQSKELALVDRALMKANDVLRTRVQRLRERHPDATPEQLVKKLETMLLSSVAATGAATGGAAAVPGAGTAAAVAMTAGDASWFLSASAAHVLAVLHVHGVRIDDLEHQKAVVLTVLAGGSGSSLTGKAAARTGSHLGKLLAESVPMTTIRSVNKVLGRNFVTKYGTKQGILVIGKAAPFGIGAAIGAGGNVLFARSVITATRKAVETAKSVE
ncbi:hypothetical protein [Nocardia jiangsuensis]|uniref:EcsC family protein n=1 Tax=Nocardia jiangsuensis TaxID=1691563 RepID=A0ABV8DL90_9NOCA